MQAHGAFSENEHVPAERAKNSAGATRGCITPARKGGSRTGEQAVNGVQ